MALSRELKGLGISPSRSRKRRAQVPEEGPVLVSEPIKTIPVDDDETKRLVAQTIAGEKEFKVRSRG